MNNECKCELFSVILACSVCVESMVCIDCTKVKFRFTYETAQEGKKVVMEMLY